MDALTNAAFRITNSVKVCVWVAKNPGKNDPNLNGLMKPVETHLWAYVGYQDCLSSQITFQGFNETVWVVINDPLKQPQ